MVGHLAALSFIDSFSIFCRPSLLPDLLHIVDSGMQSRYSAVPPQTSSVTLRRALEALNAVLKEFAHIKMLTGIRTMASVSRM